MKEKFNKLPKDFVEDCKKHFENDMAVVAIRDTIRSRIERRDFKGAKQTKDELERSFMRFCVKLASSQKVETVQLGELFKDFNKEDEYAMKLQVNTIALMGDFLDCRIADMNELLHKYHPDYNIEQFYGLKKAVDAVKNHMGTISKQDEDFQMLFSDIASDVDEMVMNKAKALMRKAKYKE